ncbi:MAG: 50S ribosomal protein L16 [Candidatus Marsarchaeota archaeon]|jgi:large subunit ribosomal protein L10e|nr:50S ribosomal protein L16 [Candidatus Marsarchaeota archaeon]
MARLRPARTCRALNSQSWARYSLKKPKKNYIRALPHTSLLIFDMGTRNGSYDLKMTLNAEQPIQLRSNSLEAARQVANKYLETVIPMGYHFKVLVYPHSVIREHKMATGAGADRISQGMSNAFGRPVSVAARLRLGQPVFAINTSSKNRQHVLEAFRRASSKLSGTYKAKVVAS